MRTTLNNIFSHPIVLLLIRLGVGGIFLLFGFIKAIEPKGAFFTSIIDYHILPESIVPAFAMIIIGLEITVGIFFMVGLFTRWAAWGISGLLVLFIIALSQAILRGLALSDCGCSGSLIQLGEDPQTVLMRDIGMLIAMVWFIVQKTTSKKWTVDQLFERKSA